jgi:hypothetical protein
MRSPKLKPSEVIFAVIFLAPFLGVGGWAAWMIASEYQTSARLATWQETTAQVIRVTLEETTSGSSDASLISAQYRYEFAGKSYEGTRVGTVDSGGLGLELSTRSETLVQHRDSKQPVPCFVNPNTASEAVLYTAPVWDRCVFFAIFVLVFGGVGLAGYISLIVIALRTPHSSTDETVIGSENRSAVFGMWAVAALWNCISSPVLLVLARELRKGNYAILLALLFPLVGLWLLWRALHATAQYLKFGCASLQLESTPGVIGGYLRGHIHVRTPVEAESVEVALDCIQMEISGNGKNRSRTANVVWQQVRASKPDLDGRGGCRIPVDFTIPYECLPSSPSTDRNWHVRAEAAVDGIDFGSKFTVPVDRTDASDPAIDSTAVICEDYGPVDSKTAPARERRREPPIRHSDRLAAAPQGGLGHDRPQHCLGRNRRRHHHHTWAWKVVLPARFWVLRANLRELCLQHDVQESPCPA